MRFQVGDIVAAPFVIPGRMVEETFLLITSARSVTLPDGRDGYIYHVHGSERGLVGLDTIGTLVDQLHPDNENPADLVGLQGGES